MHSWSDNAEAAGITLGASQHKTLDIESELLQSAHGAASPTLPSRPQLAGPLRRSTALPAAARLRSWRLACGQFGGFNCLESVLKARADVRKARGSALTALSQSVTFP